MNSPPFSGDVNMKFVNDLIHQGNSGVSTAPGQACAKVASGTGSQDKVHPQDLVISEHTDTQHPCIWLGLA